MPCRCWPGSNMCRSLWVSTKIQKWLIWAKFENSNYIPVPLTIGQKARETSLLKTQTSVKTFSATKCSSVSWANFITGVTVSDDGQIWRISFAQIFACVSVWSIKNHPVQESQQWWFTNWMFLYRLDNVYIKKKNAIDQSFAWPKNWFAHY